MKKSFFIITGFTLAEVLITLTVIGVIAALTIPSLLQNIQDAQYKTAWKEVYSQLSQATQRMMTDNGGTLVNVCPDTNGTTCMRDKYISYMINAKSCDDGQSAGNCWHNDTDSKWLNGNLVNLWLSRATLILPNSAMLEFWWQQSDCNFMWNKPMCGWINIDVNGFKGPNVVGKDIFGVLVYKNGIVPTGQDGWPYSPMRNWCDPTNGANGQGFGCSALYLMQ